MRRSVAKKLTGHKSDAIYNNYVIVASQDLKDGIAKLAPVHRIPESQDAGGY